MARLSCVCSDLYLLVSPTMSGRAVLLTSNFAFNNDIDIDFHSRMCLLLTLDECRYQPSDSISRAYQPHTHRTSATAAAANYHPDSHVLTISTLSE